MGFRTSSRLTNYLHIGELLHGQGVAAHAGPEQLLRWLEKQIANKKWRDENQTQLRLETDAAAVQLCSIHKSKGLEYPIVYCPTLWHVYGGDPSSIILARLNAAGQPLDIPEIDVGSPAISSRQAQDTADGMAEDRRLLYVALTRARHQCRIYWTAFAQAEESALGQIMFGPMSGKESDADLESKIGDWIARVGADRLVVRGAAEVGATADQNMYLPRNDGPIILSSRPVNRPVLSILAQTSFSALSRSLVETDDSGIADRDAGPAEAPPAVDVIEAPASADQQVPLAEMPGGCKVGNLVHEVLEKLLGRGSLLGSDHTAIKSAAAGLLLPELPRTRLQVCWQEPLACVLADCLTVPLTVDGVTCRLANVPVSDLTCEMPFLLSVGGPEQNVDLARMGDAFLLSQCPLIQSYGKRVQAIQQGKMRGFLGGFIDLVFRWHGKWYVVDYKTNQLGRRMSDYSVPNLGRAMVEHDYQLQAHLYVVAINHFLRQRALDFRYEGDFGGFIYLFLRGLDPSGNTGCGVYFHRPGEAVVNALSDALTGRGEENAA
jgi:exodeoxyribonuclease V beta subunit